MSKSEIVAIVDKSGSMMQIKEDAIGGFNSFLKDQKEVEGEANMTLALFDHEYEMVYQGKSIDEAPELDESTYQPSGMTALLDAVGRTVDSVGERLDNLSESERPDNVIVFILTDGHENSSSDYKRDRIKEMIEHQESKYGWEFIYGGANQDAFSEAGGLGIKAKNTFNFDESSEGTRKAYNTSSDLTTQYRTN